MIEERWRQVDKIFHDILEKKIGERGAFLDIACAGDASLRKEVDSLLRSHGKAAAFLDSPAGEQMDGSISLRVSDPLTGRTFGRYELRSLLGSGGMGDVYRARDSELKRDIAIKVLPDAFSKDAGRVSRFRREAEVLASLSHPNIATIYDFETLGDSQCLVLELVEGETLAERLANGPIPLDEALRLAKQIADALEAAHEKGVIHRDLKPANIKITPDGTAKVLDFGLAKVRGDEDAASVESSNLRDTRATTPGMVVGTAAYMSPEQARGKSVDRRTDIWAFGCVLYEMLTGRAVFGRDIATDTLAAILERDPDWSALPATTPATIQRLLFRCLDKNLRSRLRDIADARLELEDVLSGATPGSQGAMTRGLNVPRWSIAVSLVALAALIAVGALLWNIPRASTALPAPQVLRTLILGVNDPPVRNEGGLRSVALTPDATHVLYIGGMNTLFDRPLNGLEAKPILSGAAPLNFIFADDHTVGYQEGTALKKMPLTGGPSTTILDGPRKPLVGATFAPEDTIIFADEDPKTGLRRVSGNGGEVKTLTWPNSDRGELDHIWPEMLPGGNAVLFTITFDTGKPGDSQLAVLDLATGKVTNLSVGGSHAHYGPSGHLLYASDGKLQAIGFDAVGLKTIGTPFTLAPVRIRRPLVDATGDFDVADNGTLVYVDAPAPGTSAQEMHAERNVVWVSRDGKEEPLGTPPDRYLQPRLSIDATRVAMPSGGKNGNIRIWDLALRTFLNQVTFTDGVEYSPIWLDGTHVAFFHPKGSAGFTLLKQDVDGRSVAVGLASGPPSSMTPDRKALLFSKSAKELWRLPLDNPRQAEPLLSEPSSIVRNAVVSPDSRWLAYESDKEIRGEFEIYMANYSDVSARQWKISVGGGIMPLWNPSSSPDNPELFYVAPDGAIQSVHLGNGGMRRGDASTVVVAGPYVTLTEATTRAYDVSRNGQQFLVVKRSPKEEGATPPQIILYQNWVNDPNHPIP